MQTSPFSGGNGNGKKRSRRSKTNDFVSRLEEGKISGTQCKKCGLKFFPPRADCYQCLSSDMEWFEVAGTGKLAAFSKLKYGPIGFENDLPYCIAVLDYDGYKVFGRIDKDLEDDEIKIGMDMKSVANTLPNGQLNYIFQKA